MAVPAGEVEQHALRRLHIGGLIGAAEHRGTHGRLDESRTTHLATEIAVPTRTCLPSENSVLAAFIDVAAEWRSCGHDVEGGRYKRLRAPATNNTDSSTGL